MRLERMGGDAGVITPDLMQQHVAGDHALAGTIKLFEDRGFLLGESYIAAAAVDQQFGGRLKSVWTDSYNAILAHLVLAELGADAGEQHAELERLGDIVIGAGFQAENGVGIGGLRCEHDDRPLEAAAAEQLAGLASIDVGKPNIEKHEVHMAVARQLEAFRGIGREQRIELLVQGKLLAQGVAKLIVVIDDQDLARIAHGWPRLNPEASSNKGGLPRGQAGRFA